MELDLAFLSTKFIEEIGYDAEEVNTIDKWFIKAYPSAEHRKEVISGYRNRIEEAITNKQNSDSNQGQNLGSV